MTLAAAVKREADRLPTAVQRYGHYGLIAVLLVAQIAARMFMKRRSVQQDARARLALMPEAQREALSLLAKERRSLGAVGVSAPAGTAEQTDAAAASAEVDAEEDDATARRTVNEAKKDR